MNDFPENDPEEQRSISQLASQVWQTLKNLFIVVFQLVVNNLERIKPYLPKIKLRTNNGADTYDSDAALTDFPDEYVSFNTVSLKQEFRPPLTTGLIIHIGALLIVGGGFIYTFITAVSQDVGNYFLLYLLLSIVFLIPLPLILYRGYSLLRARYILNREGLKIRWGLRSEDIPLPEIEWIGPANELDETFPLPLISVPGAIIGTKRIDDLGIVEFMSADKECILLVATNKQIYAVSPDDPQEFLYTYQRSIELGSLAPIEAQSVLPAVFIKQFWQDRNARTPLLLGTALTITLFILVGIIIPSRETISLGFNPDGTPHTPGPSETLLLLPILAGFAFILDLLLGLFYYRRENTRIVSYTLWISTSILPIILLVALIFLE